MMTMICPLPFVDVNFTFITQELRYEWLPGLCYDISEVVKPELIQLTMSEHGSKPYDILNMIKDERL